MIRLYEVHPEEIRKKEKKRIRGFLLAQNWSTRIFYFSDCFFSEGFHLEGKLKKEKKNDTTKLDFGHAKDKFIINPQKYKLHYLNWHLNLIVQFRQSKPNLKLSPIQAKKMIEIKS